MFNFLSMLGRMWNDGLSGFPWKAGNRADENGQGVEEVCEVIGRILLNERHPIKTKGPTALVIPPLISLREKVNLLILMANPILQILYTVYR
jgi:hypothetical protein